MKKCELCNSVARMYCDSDQASLCWDCDARVHAANFLVAKHSRTLLCHSCQSPTPWTGSGSRFGHTLSLCHACAIKDSSSSSYAHSPRDHQQNDDPDQEDDDEEDEDEDEDDDDDDDDEGENQVVPLSSSLTNRPVISDSSTSSEDSSSRVFSGFDASGIGFSWKSLH